MKLAILLAALLLSGCATDWREIRWVKGTHAEIQAACGGSFRRPLAGCAKELGNKCVIYTLTLDYLKDEDRYEQIIGHELRHCFEGAFHR